MEKDYSFPKKVVEENRAIAQEKGAALAFSYVDKSLKIQGEKVWQDKRERCKRWLSEVLEKLR